MGLQEKLREDFFRLKRIKTRLESEEEETIKVQQAIG
jgi:vacuolar-type H+-ATPase subunit D/Vma8